MLILSEKIQLKCDSKAQAKADNHTFFRQQKAKLMTESDRSTDAVNFN